MAFATNKTGFTLIELLVVVAIISLLATIVLASLNDSRDRAKWRAFDSEILEIRTAVQLYRENNDGAWPPTLYDDYPNFTNLISQLNSASLYNGDVPTTPDGYALYLYKGYLSDNTYYMSCGGTALKQDVYFTVYTLSDINEESNIFGEFFHSTAGHLPQYSCFEVVK